MPFVRPVVEPHLTMPTPHTAACCAVDGNLFGGENWRVEFPDTKLVNSPENTFLF